MNVAGLCQPASAILLISIAGFLYHSVAGHWHAVLMWLLIGVIGTGSFQALCSGQLDAVAWIIMLIPVLIVCFFLAVALFASRMRIENIMSVPCDRCGHKHEHHEPCRPKKKPHCKRHRCDDHCKPRCPCTE